MRMSLIVTVHRDTGADTKQYDAAFPSNPSSDDIHEQASMLVMLPPYIGDYAQYPKGRRNTYPADVHFEVDQECITIWRQNNDGLLPVPSSSEKLRYRSIPIQVINE